MICYRLDTDLLRLDKAHYADRNSRRMVTGVKINAGLNVDRRYIRALLHSIETLGLADAQPKFTGLGGKGALAAHLRGKIASVSHLKGATDLVVRAFVLRYNKSFGGTPITLVPTAEERRDRSVWVVDHIDQYGSASFLKGVGLVTVAHCVNGLSEVEILHPSKHTTTFSAKVLKRHDHRDLAILDTSTIPATEYFELDVATTPLLVGDPVTAVGYPHWGRATGSTIAPVSSA